MSFSNEIITILNDLGKRFGIAIDWTSQNIVPYIKDLCERIINFKLVENIVGLIVACLFFAVSLFILIWILKDYMKLKKTDSSTTFFIRGCYFNEMNVLGIVLTAVGCVGFLVCITMIRCIITDLIKIKFVPELYLLDYIKNLSI